MRLNPTIRAYSISGLLCLTQPYGEGTRSKLALVKVSGNQFKNVPLTFMALPFKELSEM